MTPNITGTTAYLLIYQLRSSRPELVHFAAAAHRDPAALEVCREYQRDPSASEDELRARARATGLRRVDLIAPVKSLSAP